MGDGAARAFLPAAPISFTQETEAKGILPWKIIQTALADQLVRPIATLRSVIPPKISGVQK